MPGSGACPCLEVGLEPFILCTTVDEMNLRIALGGSRGGMDVMTSKVAAVLEGIGDGQLSKVLVTEGDDLALSDETGQLVFAGIIQRGQLNASDFSSDGRSEMCDLGALG